MDNPYASPGNDVSAETARPPSPRRWAAVGFFIVFLPIAFLGIRGLYLDARYAATLPPNVVRCENCMLAAMLLIFPIGPILGSIGAGVGYVSAILCGAVFGGSVAQVRSGT